MTYSQWINEVSSFNLLALPAPLRQTVQLNPNSLFQGFKTLILSEAATFLKPNQTLLSSTVKNIAYTDSGVSVTLTSGKVLKATYAITTFSIGVLQKNDVTWTPALPHWKREAILTMKMATYTKVREINDVRKCSNAVDWFFSLFHRCRSSSSSIKCFGTALR